MPNEYTRRAQIDSEHCRAICDEIGYRLRLFGSRRQWRCFVSKTSEFLIGIDLEVGERANKVHAACRCLVEASANQATSSRTFAVRCQCMSSMDGTRPALQKSAPFGGRGRAI